MPAQLNKMPIKRKTVFILIYGFLLQ